MIQNRWNKKRIARFRFVGILVLAYFTFAARVNADPVAVQWPQPQGKGSSIAITYSYANLLDGAFLLIKPADLRAATEEALRLWARYAPLHFIEVPDSGGPVSDQSYAAAGNPQIRFGHHVLPELAHGFYPGTDGLSGDVHFASGIPWTIGDGNWNYLEAVTHELGHALGLVHELNEIAVMNPSYPAHRFTRLGSAHLYPADIRQLQGIYGAGVGSVEPLSPAPEPGTSLLVLTGVMTLARYRRRQRKETASSAANSDK